MRALVPIVLALLIGGLPATAGARRHAVRSPDGEHRAEVRRAAVLVDGERIWRGQRVLSPLVWSRHGGALAFTGRDAVGRTTLVVIVVLDGFAPAALTWPVPRSAEPALAVTWLGPGRLGAGPSVLDPRVVATFDTLKP